jgi:hypothetical protein
VHRVNTPSLAPAGQKPVDESSPAGLVGQRLSMEAFHQLAGVLAGYPFVKVVVDRPAQRIHFINNARYQFHVDYIGEQILQANLEQLLEDIDEFNRGVYFKPDRRFYLGIVAFHSREGKSFFTLETVEVDTMDAPMLRFFYAFVKERLDPSVPLLFKLANHLQETFMAEIDSAEIPRIHNHELFASAEFVALNKGQSRGRLRVFKTEEEYRNKFHTIDWYDILVMARVPEDIPRVSGLINAQHTTPLSHTNVLASGWQIPNAIQLGIMERAEREQLDGHWVDYRVSLESSRVHLDKIDKPAEISQRPAWYAQQVKLEEPDTARTPIQTLEGLRMTDHSRYGTKAANLGELHRVLEKGSERLLGFYQIARPPRQNLLPYLARLLGAPESEELDRSAWEFLKAAISIPRGIAIPFSLQQGFLQVSPQIQQQVGKLKMALELNAKIIDPLSLELQQMIRSARMSDGLRDYIDTQIVKHLGGVSSFVVRSSSNAEDLENFSAAGIYESINHVTTANKIFESLREVWASLVSPRSVRLRHEVGIPLDDCYMGVIIQEEIKSDMGGVLVTKNPTQAEDFRNVYVNASCRSVQSVVQGSDLPYQFLYNTVEGGGRTLSIGNARHDLEASRKAVLQKLAIVGRLLQSHYAQDYTFNTPLDIEWATQGDRIYLLQLRPYAK